MTDPQNPESRALTPEGEGNAPQGSGSQGSGSTGSKAKRDVASDVVLYDEATHGRGAIAASQLAKSGSSTSPSMPPTVPATPSMGRTTGGSSPSTPSASTPSGTGTSGTASSNTNVRTATPVPLAWRVWPVIDSVWELLGLSAILLVVPLVVWSLSGRSSLVVICTFAVGAVTWRHFFPTICEMNALGVTQRLFGRTKRIPWLSIDRYVVGNRGVFLTSAGAPLEMFRGLYLPWGAHREQILASLRYYLPHAEDAG